MSKYRWTKGMGEISGFGGSYERACQKMLIAGLEWFDEHPDADPKFQGMRGVFGVLLDDNDDAKALSKVVVLASGGDATGAMHQAVIQSILWIRKNGWAAYQAAMRKGKADARA